MTIVSKLPNWLHAAGVNAQQSELPPWLATWRQHHWDTLLGAGLPTRKQERWRYADLSFLAQASFVNATRPSVATVRELIQQQQLARDNTCLLVVANGYFFPELSFCQQLPVGVTVCSVREAWQQRPQWLQAYWQMTVNEDTQAIANLNAATMTDGILIHVLDHCQLEQPIHLLSLACTDEHFIASPHHLLVLGEGSQATVFEEHVGLNAHAYMMTQAMHVHVAKGARLTHTKWQRESQHALHFSMTQVRQHQDSQVTSTSLSAGAAFARDEVTVHLQGRGAQCDMGGLYRLRHDQQYIDHHLDVVHVAPHTQSQMLYKGILAGKSRAVFNGRLHVTPDAQKIVARQANHNLLLSANAEVYAKPELEIYADDVQCQHGATTGQLDQDAIFYLRARGIPVEDAVHMLLDGFAGEVLQRVNQLGIQPVITQE